MPRCSSLTQPHRLFSSLTTFTELFTDSFVWIINIPCNQRPLDSSFCHCILPVCSFLFRNPIVSLPSIYRTLLSLISYLPLIHFSISFLFTQSVKCEKRHGDFDLGVFFYNEGAKVERECAVICHKAIKRRGVCVLIRR